MKIPLTIIVLLLLANLTYAEPSKLLYKSMVDFCEALPDERKSGFALPKTVSGLPKELTPIFEVTKEERELLGKGKSLYTEKQFEDLLKQASNLGIELPVITVALVNRGREKELKPAELTLACRFIEHAIKQQNKSE